jgi:hypothetical protein
MSKSKLSKCIVCEHPNWTWKDIQANAIKNSDMCFECELKYEYQLEFISRNKNSSEHTS